MTTMHTGAVLRQIDRLFGTGTVAGLSDAQLLARFRTQHDEGAFVAWWRGTGRWCWRSAVACCAIEHAAEDAFQATFLILVRKASVLWVGESLGGWLHRVAHRVAMQARADADRRGAREKLGRGSGRPEASSRNILRTTGFAVCSTPRSAGCPIGCGFPWCSATWKG